ncbi:NLRC3 [Symbiodinium sp. CCMP2592]|nr:NLRC3 [Symbiodinium sp. CCMP2592]
MSPYLKDAAESPTNAASEKTAEAPTGDPGAAAPRALLLVGAGADGLDLPSGTAVRRLETASDGLVKVELPSGDHAWVSSDHLQLEAFPDGTRSRLGMFSARFDGKEVEVKIRRVYKILKDHNFNVLMVEAVGGDDFGTKTMKFLNQTRMKRGVVISVCTWHYGEKTSSTFSSYHELRYAQDYGLDLLPLRMEEVYPPKPPCGTEHEFDKDGDALDLIQMAMRPAIAYIDCRELSAMEIARAIAGSLLGGRKMSGHGHIDVNGSLFHVFPFVDTVKTRRVDCKNCDGAGYCTAGRGNKFVCPACSGEGKEVTHDHIECLECKGIGRRISQESHQLSPIVMPPKQASGRPCEACDGSGTSVKTRRVDCKNCDGAGYCTAGRGNKFVCPACSGEGEEVRRDHIECLHCKGTGRRISQVEAHTERHRESQNKWEREFISWQRSGTAPLPVVRLCLVGQGRAGKTTTLRRLRGDKSVQEGEERSTYGIDVSWAETSGEHVSESWQVCKCSMLDTLAVKALKEPRKSPQTEPGPRLDGAAAGATKERRESPQSDSQPCWTETGGHGDVSMLDAPGVGALKEVQHDTQPENSSAASVAELLAALPSSAGASNGAASPEAASLRERREGATERGKSTKTTSKKAGFKHQDVVPRSMGEDLLVKLQAKDTPGSETSMIRLRPWDFPGQQEYSDLNLLYFNGTGIYIVFCDASRELEEAWQEFRFWLWAVARFAVHEDRPTHNVRDQGEACPPIVLVATKWATKQFEAHEMDDLLELACQEMHGLSVRLRCPPQPNESKCFFCMENFGVNSEQHIQPLRACIQSVARELLEPSGLQGSLYPVPYLHAHDLLTELADGLEICVAMSLSELRAKVEEGGRQLKEAIQGTHASHGTRVLAPKGSVLKNSWAELQEQSGRVTLRLQCDSLEFVQVEQVLQGTGVDVDGVLRLLHSLGVLFWFDKEKLRDHVLLNVRSVAVALARLMSLRFWQESKFEHARAYKDELEERTQKIQKDVRRFKASGVASSALLHGLWGIDFPECQYGILIEVMIQKGMILNRGVEGEYLVPSCLPSMDVAEFPESGVCGYIQLGKQISPSMFPRIVNELCQQMATTTPTELTLKPRPPQIFRNQAELQTHSATILISLFPASSFELLRIRVLSRGDEKVEIAEACWKHVKECLFEVLGLDTSRDLVKTGQDCVVPDLDPKKFDRLLQLARCPKPQCTFVGWRSQCSQCRVSDLLQERFLPDLSEELRKVVRYISVEQDARPDGSFRFKHMAYPGDVDVEEYVIFDAEDPTKAAQRFAELLDQACQLCSSQEDLHWAGLKAGKRDGDSTLTWTAEDVRRGKMTRSDGSEIALVAALAEGHRGRSAKIDLYAKVSLFRGGNCRPRFFEVTNVLRFGYGSRGGQIKPVTKEKDFLDVVEICLHEYSGPCPKTMKYAKRLWERSAFLAQRSISLREHLVMLEALSPLLGHWLAKISQMAAHAETLHNMLKGFKPKGELVQLEKVQNDALKDLPTLCDDTQAVQQELKQKKLDATLTSDTQAELDASLLCLQEAWQCFAASAENCEEASKDVQRSLQRGQVWLEACVAIVLANKFRNLPRPVTQPLRDRWHFPTGHLPIAAEIELVGFVGPKSWLHVASWNVQIIAQAEAKRKYPTEKVLDIILAMMARNAKHLLFLQGCSPELLQTLEQRLSRDVALLHNGASAEQAVVFDKRCVSEPGVVKQDRSVTVFQFACKSGQRQFKLQVAGAQLPAAPIETFCEECKHLQGMLQGLDTTPTLLVGDLGLPEEAIGPWLPAEVSFAKVRYPTTICQGSLLPRRPDSLASLSPKLQVKALPAESVHAGLLEHVGLLQSRSLGLADADSKERIFELQNPREGSA